MTHDEFVARLRAATTRADDGLNNENRDRQLLLEKLIDDISDLLDEDDYGPPPCQPIGCDNGYHRPGCVYAEMDEDVPATAA